MKVSIYGCGLTGLVTAWALAEAGNDVLAMPCKGELAAALNEGGINVDEPSLSGKIRMQVEQGRLRFSTEQDEVFAHGHIHFLALPGDYYSAAQALLERLSVTVAGALTVVNQSTFPVGSTTKLAEKARAARQACGVEGDVDLLCLPSFMQEGSAIENFLRPNRILVGADGGHGLVQLKEVLRPFNRNHDQLMVMPTKAAEFTKYAINGMLATKLSFMNEMANLADQLEVDIEQVRQGVGSDRRIGFDYIYPGCGFGGQSFSEDVMTLVETVEAKVEDSFLLSTVMQTNRQQKEVLFRKLWRYWQADLSGRTVALWGGAFKPNTDSIDNAPALMLLEALWAQGVTVKLYDPKAMKSLGQRYGARPDLLLCDSAYQALEGAEALLITTEWKEFWSPDFTRMMRLLKEPVIFDGRNMYDPCYMQQLGFRYFGVGRSSDHCQDDSL